MIHGNCVSIGCLAMTGERVQEIWVATTALRYAGGSVHLHIFPRRDMNGLLAPGDHPEHRAFWENIREGLERFDRTKRIPLVQVDRQERYYFR